MTDFAIDDVLKAFLANGNSMIVATRNSTLEPHATRAAGLRVLGKQRIVVFLPKATSAQHVADLEANGQIAVAVGNPGTFKTVQLKGRSVRMSDASADDISVCEQQQQKFAQLVAVFGFSRAQARNLWLFDCWCVEVEVTSAYEQTPGPGTGFEIVTTP